MKYIYQFKILMKDKSINFCEDIFDLNVWSYDGNPDYFFPSIDISNIGELLKKNDPSLRVYERIFKEMHFRTGNVYDFVVEAFVKKIKGSRQVQFRVVDSFMIF